MIVKICIGSSCHLKGSHAVVARLQALVEEKALADKVELASKFCMGNCANGVCLDIDGENYSLKPDDTDTFFNNEILARVGKA